MIFLEKKENIRKFWILEGSLCLKDTNSITFRNIKLPSKKCFDILVNSTSLFINDFNTNGFEQTNIYNRSTGEKETIEEKIFMKIIEDNFIIFSSYDIEFNTFFGVSSLKKNMTLWQKKEPGFFHSLYDKSIIFSNENYLIALDFKTGKEVWNYSLDKESFEVDKVISLYLNQLLVGLKSGLLIALDIDTGALLWQTPENVPIQNLRLSESEGILYGLQLHKFVTINAQNGAILVAKDIEPYLDSYFGCTLFFIRTSKLYNGLIYFVGGRKGVSDTVGIFDPKQEKIIWHYQLELPKGELIGAGDDKIQITDTKLYVLDTTNTLHIFEREQDEV